MTTLPYSPYNWQSECLRAWKNNNYRGIANVVTGAGKTMLALFATKQLLAEHPGQRISVKIIVPTLELMKQWRSVLIHQYGLSSRDIGCYSSDYKSSTERPFMVYIVNSARTVLRSHIAKDLSRNHDIFLIADECHHYASTENRHIFDFMQDIPEQTSLYTLGLSATPQVHGYDAVLLPFLGKEIYHYNHKQAIDENTLSTFCLLQIGLHFSANEQTDYIELSDRMNLIMGRLMKLAPYLKQLTGVAFFSAVRTLAGSAHKPESQLNTFQASELAQACLLASFQRKELVYLSKSRLLCLQDLVKQLDITKKIIIFCERITQAEQACKALEELYPGKTACYHSEHPRAYRTRTMNAFRDGSIRILVACRCLDEGIDVPDAAIGIILSGTSMARQRIQRLGRILRKNDTKDMATLYYLYIKESSEEAAYLPDMLYDIPVSFLYYSPAEASFMHPVYEDACLRYLRELEDRGIDQDKIHEVRQCLLKGLLQSDWMLPPAVIQSKIENAASVRERNYWICMKKIYGDRHY